MRRRQQLRPDTFPFLAVLLCTMGSLILVLMVFDRRARLTALARAEAAWQHGEQAEAEKAARLRALGQQRRLAQHQQARTRLTAEQRRLTAEQDRVRAELDAVLRTLRSAELDEAGAARRRAAGQRAGDARQVLLRRQTELARAERTADGLRGERERLTAQLLTLEEGLVRLREQRQREQQTWSVVPYVGRRGQNVRPHYVECSADGLVFHPDKLALSGAALTPAAILEQVQRRSEKVPAGAARPYWLLLVRPDGINQYYLFLTAVKGVDVAYGYEFVDADWVLDFPDPATAPLPLPPPVTPLRTPGGRRAGGPISVAVGAGYHPGPHRSGSEAATPAGGFQGSPAGSGSGLPGGSGPGGSLPHGSVADGAGVGGSAGGSVVPGGSAPGAVAGGAVVGGFSSGGVPGGTPGGGSPQGGDSFLGQGGNDPVAGSPGTSVPAFPGRPGGGSGDSPGPGGGGEGTAGERPQGDGSGGGRAAVQILPPQGAPAAQTPQMSPLFPSPRSGSPGGGGAGSRPGGSGEGTGASAGPPAAGQSTGPPSAVPPGQENAGSPTFLPPVGDRVAGGKAGTQGTGGQGSGGTATGNSTAGGTAIGSRPATGQPAGPPERPGNIGTPAQGGPLPRAPLRPASRYGDGEFVLVVDCTAWGVQLSPSRLSIPVADLGRDRDGAALLARTVRTLVERRRAAHDPEGGPFLPLIRFVVHRDGLRAFHLAHPALDSLPVRKRTVVSDEE